MPIAARPAPTARAWNRRCEARIADTEVQSACNHGVVIVVPPPPRNLGGALSPLLLLALAPAALAAPSDADLAEQVRIDEEMKVLVTRGQWKGADQRYRSLVELETRGVVLTYAQHMLGVQIARSVGDLGEARARLTRAGQLGDTDEVRGQLADIDARFGRVDLEVDARAAGAWSLVLTPAPFAPDARAALEHANATLAQSRRFVGLLPAGTYALGTVEFEVEAGGNPVLLAVSGNASSGVARARTPDEPQEIEGRVGLRARASGGYGGATTPGSGVVAPPGGGGLAPVLVAGPAWRHGALELGAEIGMRGFFASATAAGGQRVVGASIGAVAGWHAGPVLLEVGGVYVLGSGRSAGASEVAVPGCRDGACDDEALTGSVRAGGAELGVGTRLWAVGAHALGLAAHGGALSDGDRTYPWVTAGLVLGPGGE